ncbi:transposable element Tcb2 transposase [Trichonephila clavipes]|nr:transposable element Tcb2 transposase [Trichonephila clavipes]
MDDNSRPHRANLVEDFLFEEGIVRMEWPACSPDMNPIEHVWDALGRRVAGRQPPPQTLQELERALLEEWDRIPQLMINSLIDSMPQSAFAARGTLSSRLAASPFMRLVEEEERWGASDLPQVFSIQIGVEPSQIVPKSPELGSQLRLKTDVQLAA